MGTPMILNAWFESDVSESCASYISMVLTMDNWLNLFGYILFW